jgi:hypothetical protein
MGRQLIGVAIFEPLPLFNKQHKIGLHSVLPIARMRRGSRP